MAAFRDEGITSSTSDSSSSMLARLRASASGDRIGRSCNMLLERGASLGDTDLRSQAGEACAPTGVSRTGCAGGCNAESMPSGSPLSPVGDVGGEESGVDGRSMDCKGARSGVAETSVLAGALASCESVRCRLPACTDAGRAADEAMVVVSGAEEVRCRLTGRTSRHDMTTSLLMRVELVKDDRLVVRSACKIGCLSCGTGGASGAGPGLAAETLRFQGRRRLGVRDGPGAKHLDRNVAHIRGARCSKYLSATSAQNHCASSRSSLAAWIRVSEPYMGRDNERPAESCSRHSWSAYASKSAWSAG